MFNTVSFFLLILNKDELLKCSPGNLKSICEKFLPKIHYSTLQLQDASVGPTKLEWETIYQRLVVEKRGGLCYERDEVLWQLLNKIGYEVLGEELYRGYHIRLSIVLPVENRKKLIISL